MEEQDGNHGMGHVKLGFIGFGLMGKNLCRGFLKSGIVQAQNVIIYDVNLESMSKAMDQADSELFRDINRGINNAAVVEFADVLFLCVKPDYVKDVLEEIRGVLDTSRHCIISIAAGITIAQLEGWSPPNAHIIRCMPNACVSVLQGMTVISQGSSANERDEQNATVLMSKVGLCITLPEKHLNAVTAISGSGPAYAFMAINAMAKAGSMLGIPIHIARTLASQTFLGAGSMQLATKSHPEVLVDTVTSPGGTTAAGIFVLDKGRFTGCIMEGIKAAHDRAVELSMENP